MNNIKNPLIWILIIIISISLSLTGLGSSFFTNKKEDINNNIAIKIKKNLISWYEIDLLTKKIIEQKNIKKNLKSEDIKYEIKKILEANIKYNILINNINTIIPNSAIAEKIQNSSNSSSCLR